MVTVEKLELLAGFEFDDVDAARAEAVIEFVTDAAEGMIGTSIDLLTNDQLVNAVIVSACLRLIQNRAGVATETIGGFTAQYPSSGRIFSDEEQVLLRRVQSSSAGTIVIRNPYRYEAE